MLRSFEPLLVCTCGRVPVAVPLTKCAPQVVILSLAARRAFADSEAARHRSLHGGSHSRDLPIGIRLLAHLQLSLVLHGPLVRHLQPLRDLRVGLRHAHSRVQIHPDNLADHLTQDAGR